MKTRLGTLLLIIGFAASVSAQAPIPPDAFPTRPMPPLVYPSPFGCAGTAATGSVLTSGGAGACGIWSASPTLTKLTISVPGIALTSTDGLLLQNLTAATGGTTIQFSPAHRQTGTAWDTGASQTVSFFSQVEPSSAATPTGRWILYSSVNGAAAVANLQVKSSGIFQYGDTTTQRLYFDSTNSPISLIVGSTTAIGWGATTDASAAIPTSGFSRLGTASVALGNPQAGGIGDFTGTLKLTTLNAVTDYQVNGVLAVSATAPTIASGGCTNPAVTWANGTAAFKLTIGSSCTGVKTIVLTMPTPSNAWVCNVHDITTNTFEPDMSASSGTSVTISNYSTIRVLTDFTAAEVLLVSCVGG